VSQKPYCQPDVKVSAARVKRVGVRAHNSDRQLSGVKNSYPVQGVPICRENRLNAMSNLAPREMIIPPATFVLLDSLFGHKSGGGTEFGL